MYAFSLSLYKHIYYTHSYISLSLYKHIYIYSSLSIYKSTCVHKHRSLSLSLIYIYIYIYIVLYLSTYQFACISMDFFILCDVNVSIHQFQSFPIFILFMETMAGPVEFCWAEFSVQMYVEIVRGRTRVGAAGFPRPFWAGWTGIHAIEGKHAQRKTLFMHVATSLIGNCGPTLYYLCLFSTA